MTIESPCKVSPQSGWLATHHSLTHCAASNTEYMAKPVLVYTQCIQTGKKNNALFILCILLYNYTQITYKLLYYSLLCTRMSCKNRVAHYLNLF